MPTKLFTTQQIQRYFTILNKMGRVVENKYLGYDKKNPHITPCQKEVFVNRTLNKWLKNKYVILYAVSEQTDEQYKEYVSISNIQYYLNAYGGDKLSVSIYDYSKPMDIWNSIKISHNDALDLEGEWIEDPTEYHHKLLKMTYLSIPEKEYVFEMHDFSKCPKRGVKKEIALERIKTTISFKAKTEREAYILKSKHNIPNQVIGELIQVKLNPM